MGRGPHAPLIRHFYPRSPCGERPRIALMVGKPPAFLSTLSLRRATADVVPVQYRDQDFYPRSPCGERLIFAARHPAVGVFLSTLSLRRATPYLTGAFYEIVISIHALLAESDLFALLCNLLHHNFYPRSPCGERPL